jgi:hypothetical protein
MRSLSASSILLCIESPCALPDKTSRQQKSGTRPNKDETKSVKPPEKEGGRERKKAGERERERLRERERERETRCSLEPQNSM